MFDKMWRFAALAFAGVALVLTGCEDAGSSGAWDPQVTEFDRFYGKADAPVTVIEYASLTCPHCASFHANVLPQFKKEYIDTGKVRLVYRDFPLNQPALTAAMVARCAPEDQYFAWIDLLFTNLNQWGRGNPTENLAKLAVMGGMGREKFDACIGDSDVQAQIIESQIAGEKQYKVQSTPSFVVDGKLLDHGGTMASLRAAIDPLLAE